MFKPGDKVIYIGDPRLLRGVIVDLIWDPYLNVATYALVEWDDKDLIPRQMRIPVVELKLDLDAMANDKAKGLTIDDCECGLKYVSGGEHSSWCQLFGKGIYP